MNISEGALLQSGKYRIIKTIGQGGFGITYLGEQAGLGRKVAIKEFFMSDYCERDNDTSQVSMGTSGSREMVEKFRQKFVKEAQTIATLKHPHIISIYDIFEENNTAYYVMEYIDGVSLNDKAGSNGLPEDVALRYVRQVAEALGYLHGKRMLHLDVKPHNILIDKDDNAVLIDFGLAKHYDDEGRQTTISPVGISHGYAPIEQYSSGVSTFTPVTDIYSLGATLYKALSGATPPEASEMQDNELPPLPQHVSAATCNTVKCAMQSRRKDRPQSAAEFLALLDGVGKEGKNEVTLIDEEVSPRKAKTEKTTVINDEVQPCKVKTEKTTVINDEVQPCEVNTNETTIIDEEVPPCKVVASETTIIDEDVPPCKASTNETTIIDEDVSPCEVVASETTIIDEEVSPCEVNTNETTIIDEEVPPCKVVASEIEEVQPRKAKTEKTTVINDEVPPRKAKNEKTVVIDGEKEKKSDVKNSGSPINNPTPNDKKKSNSKLWILLVILLGIIVGGVGYYLLNSDGIVLQQEDSSSTVVVADSVLAINTDSIAPTHTDSILPYSMDSLEQTEYEPKQMEEKEPIAETNEPKQRVKQVSIVAKNEPKQKLEQEPVTINNEPKQKEEQGREEQETARQVAPETNRTYQIGDYYTCNGVKGVVFALSDDGRHGKIVSMDEAKLQWCTQEQYDKDIVTSASSETNGKSNTDKIAERGVENYPPVKWCRDKGSNWYLPAKNELEAIYNNKSVINDTLSKHGGKKLRVSTTNYPWYWSSTENDESGAWNVYMYDGDARSYNKNRSNYVRAVLAF